MSVRAAKVESPQGQFEGWRDLQKITENDAGALRSGTPGDPEGFVQRNKRTFVIRLVVGVAAAITVALVLLLTGQGELLWQFFSDQQQIQQLVDGVGLLAPTAYILLLVVQAVVAPLPAPAVAMAGGYSFGTFEGFLLTWAGALLGRFLLRPLAPVRPWIRRDEAIFELRVPRATKLLRCVNRSTSRAEGRDGDATLSETRRDIWRSVVLRDHQGFRTMAQRS